jgi:hypothetical protein
VRSSAENVCGMPKAIFQILEFNISHRGSRVFGRNIDYLVEGEVGEGGRKTFLAEITCLHKISCLRGRFFLGKTGGVFLR